MEFFKQLNENVTLQVRQMQESDIDQVAELEKEIFPNPWSKVSFAAELLHKYSICLVVFDDERIIAYSVNWFIEDELHIANLAVSSDYRKMGIASWLMEIILSLSESISTRVIHLEVRKSNEQAINLYKKFGFKEVGLRKNYYEKEHEDALLMSLNLN